MVELSNQYALVFLCPLTFSDVDVDANDSMEITITVIRNKTE